MSSPSFLWFVGLILLLALIWVTRSSGRRRVNPPRPAPRGDLKSAERTDDDRPDDVRH